MCGRAYRSLHNSLVRVGHSLIQSYFFERSSLQPHSSLIRAFEVNVCPNSFRLPGILHLQSNPCIDKLAQSSFTASDQNPHTRENCTAIPTSSTINAIALGARKRIGQAKS